MACHSFLSLRLRATIFPHSEHGVVPQPDVRRDVRGGRLHLVRGAQGGERTEEKSGCVVRLRTAERGQATPLTADAAATETSAFLLQWWAALSPVPSTGITCNHSLAPPSHGPQVVCSCGARFCFKCAQETHTPLTCAMVRARGARTAVGLRSARLGHLSDTRHVFTLDPREPLHRDYSYSLCTPPSPPQLRQWSEKCNSDSETVNWMLANTKKCPKCQVRTARTRATAVTATL
jgi:hypothetical protein